MRVQTTSFGLAKDPAEPSQDAFAVRAWGETVIAAVADGVGAARAGGEAAQRAVDALVNSYAERPRAWAPLKALGEFTRLANQRLFQDSAQRFGGPEMVSTLSVAVIEGDRLFGLNIGDSRVYLSRGGKLEQLSTDHVLDGAERSHVLSRALGLSEQIQPEYFERQLHDGDVTLLCTDGLTGVLDEPTLGKKLAARASARSLVSAARERATPELLDDISAVVLDIAETGKLRAMSELPLPIPEKLSKGDVIDGFTLLKAFQQTDRVWIAAKDEARYTLKFAPLEARDNEPLLNAFIKETWNATRISSPAFVHAFVPEEATARYYVMEFVEAPNLKTLLRSRRLAIDEAIALGAFLLKASQELLRLDLVHGDLKPENILVLSAYDSIEFKLVDFGSVTELFSIRSRAGTASYLAPERFRESPISERTEIFAIGVTLYESLTGTFPYGEVERFQTPQFAGAKDPAPLNRNIAPWLRAVLLRATAPQPERRYQNFSEMLYDLQHPEQVEPFHRAEAGLIERNPLRFYRAGFFILLAVVIVLLGLLLANVRGSDGGGPTAGEAQPLRELEQQGIALRRMNSLIRLAAPDFGHQLLMDRRQRQPLLGLVRQHCDHDVGGLIPIAGALRSDNPDFDRAGGVELLDKARRANRSPFRHEILALQPLPLGQPRPSFAALRLPIAFIRDSVPECLAPNGPLRSLEQGIPSRKRTFQGSAHGCFGLLQCRSRQDIAETGHDFLRLLSQRFQVFRFHTQRICQAISAPAPEQFKALSGAPLLLA